MKMAEQYAGEVIRASRREGARRKQCKKANSCNTGFQQDWMRKPCLAAVDTQHLSVVSWSHGEYIPGSGRDAPRAGSRQPFLEAGNMLRCGVAHLFMAGLFIPACLIVLNSCKAEEAPPPPLEERETVVLLHGMGRTRVSLALLAKRLEDAGYITLNFPYSARHEPLDEITERLHAFVRENVRTPVWHFTGHSLGNIVVRNGFREEWPPGLKHIVMLAPPNRPAHLAERLRYVPLYAWFTGDSGRKLSSEEFYADLPVPTVPFGVIAGDKGQPMTFDAPNDGIVQVENTKLDGMADWILLHHTHTFMMNSRDTADQVLYFLKHGKFDHGARETASETERED
jgi:triacylglycerol lipase